MDVETLASYRHCHDRIMATWGAFASRRGEHLRQQDRFGHAAEKVAENILEDLFCSVLDWSIGEVNNQVAYADLLLTRLGIKYLIVETKRPGSLAWNEHAVQRALDQAARYAGQQHVHSIAVSDGYMLYAGDLVGGGLRDRVFVDLSAPNPQPDLWWLSVHGIYRPRIAEGEAVLHLLPHVEHMPGADDLEQPADEQLHPKYRLPERCFAYVGNPANPQSWKLPYCLSDGSVDLKRLPKAIQAILSNYRGTKVSGIPEQAIPDVLVRLGRMAWRLGKMPGQSGETAEAYHQLADALEQLDRLGELGAGPA